MTVTDEPRIPEECEKTVERSESEQEHDLKQHFLDVQEALEQRYPETRMGYQVFREQYAAFTRSYKRFLGRSPVGNETLSREAAWKP